MKPGKYLDFLIAEKVMGDEKVVIRCPKCGSDNLEYDHRIEQGFCTDCQELLFSSGCFLSKPYSTDISAAWKVVEKLREKDICLSVAHVKHVKSSIVWEYIAKVEWYDKSLEYKFDFATSETAPHVICLAALKAVGYEIKV